MSEESDSTLSRKQKQEKRIIDAVLVHLRGMVPPTQASTVRGADGVYFKELKLTQEGERTAISHRKEVEELNKELPQLMKEANAVAREIAEHQKKEHS